MLTKLMKITIICFRVCWWIQSRPQSTVIWSFHCSVANRWRVKNKRIHTGAKSSPNWKRYVGCSFYESAPLFLRIYQCMKLLLNRPIRRIILFSTTIGQCRNTRNSQASFIQTSPCTAHHRGRFTYDRGSWSECNNYILLSRPGQWTPIWWTHVIIVYLASQYCHQICNIFISLIGRWYAR